MLFFLFVYLFLSSFSFIIILYPTLSLFSFFRRKFHSFCVYKKLGLYTLK